MTKRKLKYPESDYLDFDPFDNDRDLDLRCRSVKLVKTRKEHKCIMPEEGEHTIPTGSMARYEKAIFEGEWSACYCCIPCIESWLHTIGILPPGVVYEDDLPDDMTDEQYENWYRTSYVPDGLGCRVGPYQKAEDVEVVK